MIIAAYAGVPAQRMVDPDADSGWGAEDDRNAWELSRIYELFPPGTSYWGDTVHQAYMEGLRDQAGRLVTRLRKPIAAVAAALVERESMTGEEALEVFNRTFSRRGTR